MATSAHTSTSTEPDAPKRTHTMPNAPASQHTASQPLVSFVVPVYNAATYLDQCLDSLQTQSAGNLEIICVDDGSTDDSRAILQRRAQHDRRLVVLEQRNSGPAAARNRGMTMARGRYLGFIDADDWVDTDFTARLLDGIQSNAADLVRASIINEFPDHSEAWHGNTYLQQRAEKGDNLGLNDHGYYAWNALYDLHRLRSLGLDRFDTGCDGLEDMPFTVRAMHSLSRRRAVPEAVYHYRRGLPTQLTAISPTKIQNALIANRLCIDFANGFAYGNPEDYAEVVSRNLANLFSHFSRGVSQIPHQFDTAAQTDFYLQVCELFQRHARHELIIRYRPNPLFATLDKNGFSRFLAVACAQT